MQQVLVAVLVALALLQPVRSQVGAQETEDNHSINSELRVLHMYCNTSIPLHYMDLYVTCIYTVALHAPKKRSVLGSEPFLSFPSLCPFFAIMCITSGMLSIVGERERASCNNQMHMRNDRFIWALYTRRWKEDL